MLLYIDEFVVILNASVIAVVDTVIVVFAVAAFVRVN